MYTIYDSSDESLPQWSVGISMPQFDSLQKNIYSDVCVIGGGIAGLTTAYLLLKEGKSVSVLEAFDLGSGQTGRTTAHLSNILDDRYYNLEKLHGREGALLAAESHTEAIRKVAQIVDRENIECDFEFLNGYLFKGENDPEPSFEKEFQACLHAPILGVRLVENIPVSDFPPMVSLCFPRQAQLHPLKYIKKLAEIIRDMGGRIYTQTHADEVHGGAESFVKTREGHKVLCRSIVVATNTPVNDVVAIHTKQYPYRTYAMAFKIPEGKMEKALYWDTSDPYHYVRLTAPDVMVAGGEDHKTGQEQNPGGSYQKLEEWVRANFPFAREVLYKWSGQVMESMDSLAYLGRNPMDRDNVYVITGDSGNGMTHGTIGAMIITDQIMGRRSRWEDLYNPSRISLRATSVFIKENLNTMAQYADWIMVKSAYSLHELPIGEGRVFRHGSKLVAAYKDEHGNCETVTAVCPHLGGVVSWNSVEKSWDCPCHGSRFDCKGKVIEGPAVSDLKRVDFEEPIMVGESINATYGINPIIRA